MVSGRVKPINLKTTYIIRLQKNKILCIFVIQAEALANPLQKRMGYGDWFQSPFFMLVLLQNQKGHSCPFLTLMPTLSSQTERQIFC